VTETLTGAANSFDKIPLIERPQPTRPQLAEVDDTELPPAGQSEVALPVELVENDSTASFQSTVAATRVTIQRPKYTKHSTFRASSTDDRRMQ
jgi:hypothetical protein